MAKLTELREGFFASLLSAAEHAPKSDEPTVSVPVWMVRQAAKDVTEAEALNAELLEALEEAIVELEDCALALTKEDYNNPKFNAVIAKAKERG